jgi:flagellar motor switch protein FliN/FliY
MAEDGPLSQADIDALTSGLLGDVSSSRGVDTHALRPEAEFILEQATNVLGVLLNRQATLSVRDIRAADQSSLSTEFETDALLVRLPMNQGLPGEMCLLTHKTTAAMLCGLMMGGDGNEPFKNEDLDALNEFGNQVMGAVCTALGSRYGMSVSAGQAQTAEFIVDQSPFGLEGAAIIDADLAIEGFPGSVLRLLWSPPLTSKLSGGPSSSRSEGGSTSDKLSTSGGFDDSMSRSSSNSPPNVQMLLDINLNVTIELGRTRLSIRKILELGPGSIIELDRLAGEPVDLLVNDKIVAKGEVVVVDEYFGIRILTLISPEERIKQLK